VAQEEIYSYKSDNGEKMSMTLFLLLTQTASNLIAARSSISVIHLVKSKAIGNKHLYKRKQSDVSPVPAADTSLNYRLFAITSFLSMAAMFASNDALRFLSYPIQSLGKSCKIIPIMLMGVLVERRTFTKQQYVGALLITVGVVYINLSEINGKSGSQEERSGTIYGICLLVLSLVCDGLVGACQGIINASDPNKYMKPDALHTMYLMNAFATGFIFPVAYLSGQLIEGIKYLFHSPEMLKLLIAFNLYATLGQFFIFLTITQFSPLICTTITTSRKFITILLSVFRFGHKLTFMQWVAVFVVFFGLFIELFSKRKPKKYESIIEVSDDWRPLSVSSSHDSRSSSHDSRSPSRLIVRRTTGVLTLPP